MQTIRRSEIECDGFDEFPILRRELVAYIDEFCSHMTLAQAREWFEEAFLNKP